MGRGQFIGDPALRYTLPLSDNDAEFAVYARLREHATRRREIAARIVILEREWDLDRMLAMSLAIAALAGTILAVTVGAYWVALTIFSLVFLLQHAVQGWCPPTVVLRRFGYRTRREIDREKYALKAIRGDFEAVPLSADRAARALDAVWKI